MRPQPASPTQEVLAGVVERVTFHNSENGFCVLRAKARSHRDLVTVVGHAATISAGEWITATGEWVNDRTHGQQFRARFLLTSAPTSTEGIERYLSSGMIRGIGPVYAKKLVRAFGEKVFDVIERSVLAAVGGCGSTRALMRQRWPAFSMCWSADDRDPRQCAGTRDFRPVGSVGVGIEEPEVRDQMFVVVRSQAVPLRRYIVDVRIERGLGLLMLSSSRFVEEPREQARRKVAVSEHVRKQ
jgi:ATP-dependent exoDNAse (exonuclease V) alpha subunit